MNATDIVDTPKQMPTAAPPTELSVSDTPKPVVEENSEPQSYVHLADGSVMKCNDKDLPIGSGDSIYGHWQRGNKVYSVIGVYPVEITLKES
jgi:hypothetical protein